MKLILLKILILQYINLIAGDDFVSKDLTLTLPYFENAFKETENIYYQQYGSKVICKFHYVPFRSESDNKIETESFYKLGNYRLKLKNVVTNQIILENELDNQLIKFMVNGTALKTYLSNGMLQVESILLRKIDEYACCIGTSSQSHDDICSFLRFEKKIQIDDSQHSFLNGIFAKLFNTNISNEEKIVIYFGFGFIVISIFLFSLAFYLSSKSSQKKNNIIIPINNDTNSRLFTIQVPQIPPENIFKNDLYTRYNLIDETQCNRTIQIDCCEFPPAYEELSNRNSKEESDSKF